MVILTDDPDGVSPNPDDVFSDGEVARLINSVLYSIQETMGTWVTFLYDSTGGHLLLGRNV